MPNWTVNSVELEGNPDDLRVIASTEFDFQRLHPCPFINGIVCEEGWYEWCCAHWGTKWTASDVDWNYIDGDFTMTATFSTAWKAPHTLLAYLSMQYPTMKITNTWQEEYDYVGESIYIDGLISTKFIDTTLYKPSALEEFSEENEWFCFEEYEQYHQDDLESMEEDSSLKDTVEIYEERITYKALTDTYSKKS
jgi:hypothetical protein